MASIAAAGSAAHSAVPAAPMSQAGSPPVALLAQGGHRARVRAYEQRMRRSALLGLSITVIVSGALGAIANAGSSTALPFVADTFIGAAVYLLVRYRNAHRFAGTLWC